METAETLTFLLTDVEGSTRLWDEHPDAMSAALARHDAIVTSAVERHGGKVLKGRGEGDSFFTVFPKASEAIAAALELQLSLAREDWPPEASIRVRMALHTGEPQAREGDYYGGTVNRCARLRAAAHGSQVLISQVTSELVREVLPEQAGLRDLGSHRLKDLSRPERVFQLLYPELPVDFPALMTLDARDHNLPIEPNPLIGRSAELKRIEELLSRDDVRLLTFTGPGGVGKTRLALQAAAHALEGFAHGVWLIDLASVNDPRNVVSAVSSALGIREEGGNALPTALKNYLEAKQILLVLDNFDYVLEAASLVGGLLSACRDLKIIATSRERLRLRAEHEFQVSSLPVPQQAFDDLDVIAGYESVALFVDRAQAARPEFRLTPDNITTISAICTRLDGLPLAIELAASRIRLFSPQALSVRLERSLDLLADGPRDLPERHRNMRKTISWSYDLLAEEEKTLVARLSVFTGGWTLEAADRVCGEGSSVLDGLSSLVEKSLVRRSEVDVGDPRFSMLETIRSFAAERFADVDDAINIQRRHAEWCSALVELAELHGPRQALWLEQLEREHANIRAALEWALKAGAPDISLRLAGGASLFWRIRGYFTEGRRWLHEANKSEERSPAWAKAALGEMRLAFEQGDMSIAHELGESALHVFRELGNSRDTASCLNLLGNIALRHGNIRECRALYEEALDLCRESSDAWGSAISIQYLGTVAEAEQDSAQAQDCYTRALEVFRQLNDSRGIAGSLGNLGDLAYRRHDYGEASRLQEEAIDLFREIGDSRSAARALTSLSFVAQEQGDYRRAKGLCQEALSIVRDAGDRRGSAIVLTRLGQLAREQGDYADAADLHEQALAVFRSLGEKLRVAASLTDLGTAYYAQGNFDTALGLHEQSLQIFRELRERYGEAVCLTNLGCAQLAQADCEAACRSHQEALAIARDLRNTVLAADILQGFAATIRSRGVAQTAVRFFAASEALYESVGASMPPAVRRDMEAELAAARRELSEEAFPVAWEAGRSLTLDEVCEEALRPAIDTDAFLKAAELDR